MLNYNKIGKFLQKLRTEKGYSQEKVAEILFVTRQVISKWERGKSLPSYEMLVSLCKLYDVSANEILAAEKSNKENEEKIQNVSVEVLQDGRLRLKKACIIFSTIIIGLIIIFLSYYFISTYNKMKVYVFSGESDNFYLNNGVMMMSNEQIYFYFGNITSKSNITIEQLEIYYLKNNEKKLIIEKDTNDIFIVDYNGYNRYFDFKDLHNIINNLYVNITFNKLKNVETMKIEMTQRYTNKSLFFSNNNDISSVSSENVNEDDKEIPSKIKNEFTYNYEDKTYIYHNKTTNCDIEIKYDYENKTFAVFEKYNKYEKVWVLNFKDLSLKLENYLLNDVVNKITIASSTKFDDEIICNSGDCIDHKDEFDYFRKNYINIYFPDI